MVESDKNGRITLKPWRPPANPPTQQRTNAMRTTINIDNLLMSDALAATGLKTKREVVEYALQKIIQLKRQENIRNLRGKIKWQGNLDETRTD